MGGQRGVEREDARIAEEAALGNAVVEASSDAEGGVEGGLEVVRSEWDGVGGAGTGDGSGGAHGEIDFVCHSGGEAKVSIEAIGGVDFEENGLVGEEEDVHEASAVSADENVGAAHGVQLVGEGDRGQVEDRVAHGLSFFKDVDEALFVGEDAANIFGGGASSDSKEHCGHVGRRDVEEVEGAKHVSAIAEPEGGSTASHDTARAGDFWEHDARGRLEMENEMSKRSWSAEISDSRQRRCLRESLFR